MRCEHCGYPDSEVLETRKSDYTITRTRRCNNCLEKFRTVEIFRTAFRKLPREAMTGGIRAGMTADVRRKRDIDIAENLHLGWQHLATKYNLTKTAVYYAAARGRSASGKEHQNARSYKKDK